MKLHLRIFYTFMLGVVLLLSAIAVSMYSFQKRELVTGLEGKINITEQSIVRMLKNQRQSLIASAKTIAEDWGLRQAIGRNDTETIVSALDNHRMRARAEEAVFFGVDGSVVGSKPQMSTELIKVWQHVLQNDVFAAYRIVPIGDEYHQVVISEVKAPRKIGWLCLTYRLGELQETISEASNQSDLKIVFYTATTEPELVLASPDLKANDVAEIFAIASRDSSSGYIQAIMGSNEIIARVSSLQEPLSLQQDSKVNAVVFGFTKNVLTTLERFWNRMVVLFFIFALLSLFITYLTARGITRPLQLLLSTAKKLENGEFSTNIKIRRKDEIGDLAIAFRQMQEAVFERERKVADSMQQLEYQATHDALTGLANRRTLAQQLELANQAITTDEKCYCICILDLDGFKVVNDTSGHAAGDALLVQISVILRESVYSTDTIVRLGGDEFAILLYDCEGRVAFRICDQIRRQIEEVIFHWDGDSHRIGASIGVLSVTSTVNDTSEVLQRADAACFAAKENGRNQIHMVSDSSPLVDEKRKELHWVHRLHTAIDNDELVLFVQPVVPLNIAEPESVERVEVLVRLRNYATGKLVPPGAFIPSAERYGLSTKIDRWVVKQLLRITSVYNELFDENRTYWVNLSGSSLCDESFVDFLESIVSKNLLPHGSLNFEITETAVIRNINEASKVMHRLKSLGCQFALDDFGAGLSSFGYLKSLPVDFLKIDGMFIRNIVNDNIDRMFVKSIIDIAHAMGIKTVAEFIENQEILDEVTALGADYGQGFELGRPKELLPQVAHYAAVEQNLRKVSL